MKALYVGILTEGTTSRMRADTLRDLHVGHWELIDTDEPMRCARRVWRTAAFRFQAGPVVSRINDTILARVQGRKYDLVWVDKGIYLRPGTVHALRKIAGRLIHFTPDTAFHSNRSRNFFASAHWYDLLVTTKAFELKEYCAIAQPERVLLTTQGFYSGLHRPVQGSPLKRPAVAFIGLCEPDRERCVKTLLAAGVPVRLGGHGWERFISRHRACPDLSFVGSEIRGERYALELATASIGLGLLSKRFPELHTTRTFEIPACGTVLATERTADTSRFFNEDEVLFFNNYEELSQRVKKLLREPGRIRELALKGRTRVIEDGYDYRSVLSGIMRRVVEA